MSTPPSSPRAKSLPESRKIRSTAVFALVIFLGFLMFGPFFNPTQTVSAQSAGSSISSTSGPVSWDFGPVVAGTVTNVGIQDTCPPGLCDNHDLTITLPAPAATFYQTNTVQVTIKYTWSSTAPTDLDVFAISPNAADHGPGSPDTTSTGAGEEDLTLTDPVDGVWHIRSVASTAPLPVSAHAAIIGKENGIKADAREGRPFIFPGGGRGFDCIIERDAQRMIAGSNEGLAGLPVHADRWFTCGMLACGS